MLYINNERLVPLIAVHKPVGNAYNNSQIAPPHEQLRHVAVMGRLSSSPQRINASIQPIGAI